MAVKILASFGSLSAGKFFPRVLAGPVKMVCANTASLQIVPSKAGTSDEAQLAKNRDRLLMFTQMTLDAITTSANETPTDLQKVFKVLHEELEVSVGKELAIVSERER